MTEGIVKTILQSYFVETFRSKKKLCANPANFRRRRNIRERYEIQFKNVDVAQTHPIKIQQRKVKAVKVSLLLSFLVFYVCALNVITMCDVSVNKSGHIKLNNSHSVNTIETKLRRPRLSENFNGKLQNNSVNDETTEEYSNPSKNKRDYSNFTIDRNYTDKRIYASSCAVGFPHDLTSKPFCVQHTNFNLRPETHQFNEKIVKLGVLLPGDPGEVFSLAKVLPIVELAIPALTATDGPLPGWKILVDYRDTRCSSVDGPLAAFEFYVNGSADAFIGPGCEYVIAPVARYAGLWNIPVITAGAQAEAFTYKVPTFMTLTRMMGSYTQAGVAIRKIFEEFKWRKLGMLYHNTKLSAGKGNSPCFLTLSAIFTVLEKKDDTIPIVPFDETNTTSSKLKEILQKLSLKTRSE